LPALYAFVDYDNIEKDLRVGGPVNLAKALAPCIPASVLVAHGEVVFRLYGGWRSGGVLTHEAQTLLPLITHGSPLYISVTDSGNAVNIRVSVELADKPFGATVPLQDTFIRDRDLRKFRSRSRPWAGCLNSGVCGFAHFENWTQSTLCPTANCKAELGDVLVRDEQKMVDTLVVADIAYLVLNQSASDVVVVSSDADIWPAVLLATRSGCNVLHIHSKSGRKTPRHLLVALDNLDHFYQQTSV